MATAAKQAGLKKPSALALEQVGMVKISLNEKIRQCQHCGAKNIKQTYEIINGKERLYIGRICLERLINVNTSGNKYKALERVRLRFKLIDIDEFMSDVEEV